MKEASGIPHSGPTFMSEDPYRIDGGREGSFRGQNQTLIPAAASLCTTYQPPFWRLKLLPYESSLENFVPHPWLEFAATSQSVDVAALRTVVQYPELWRANSGTVTIPFLVFRVIHGTGRRCVESRGIITIQVHSCENWD